MKFYYDPKHPNFTIYFFKNNKVCSFCIRKIPFTVREYTSLTKSDWLALITNKLKPLDDAPNNA